MCLPSFTLSLTRGTIHSNSGRWVTLRGSTNSFLHDVNAGFAALLLHLLIPSVLQSVKLQLIFLLFFFPRQLLPFCFLYLQGKKKNRFAIPVQITCIYVLHIAGFVNIYLGINIYTVALYCTAMETIFDYIYFLWPTCLTSVHTAISHLPGPLPLDFYLEN